MKTLKDYKYPTELDLQVGNILPIYTNWQDEEKLEGNGKLLEKLPLPRYRQQFTKYDRLPFIKAEIGSYEGTNLPIMVNWSGQYWKVELVDGPRKGFITNRYIGYFFKTGIIFNTPEDEEE